ncbi:MAG TPA: hypothetical protein VLH84_03525 [Patescibacteria group bacterium]|nr:hypothetical protein [Patescibacteria group bacterium]
MTSVEKQLRRTQLEEVCEGQIFSPAQLVLGMDISVWHYRPGTSHAARAARALFSIAAGVAMHMSPAQQRAGIAEELRGHEPVFTPYWRGIVDPPDAQFPGCVAVTLTHSLHRGELVEYASHPEYPNLDPRRRMSYQTMGLGPVPPGFINAGLWLPFITVAVPTPG